MMTPKNNGFGIAASPRTQVTLINFNNSAERLRIQAVFQNESEEHAYPSTHFADGRAANRIVLWMMADYDNRQIAACSTTRLKVS